MEQIKIGRHGPATEADEWALARQRGTEVNHGFKLIKGIMK